MRVFYFVISPTRGATRGSPKALSVPLLNEKLEASGELGGR